MNPGELDLREQIGQMLRADARVVVRADHEPATKDDRHVLQRAIECQRAGDVDDDGSARRAAECNVLRVKQLRPLIAPDHGVLRYELLSPLACALSLIHGSVTHKIPLADEHSAGRGPIAAC